MEIYKVITKDRNGNPIKEEYTLSKQDAAFLQGFNSAEGKAVIETLDTNTSAGKL